MTPRITLAVLAYRQSAFIEDAVRSALAQVCEPVEVLLSDDASPDDSFKRMQALADQYRGPHHVVARRNEHNLGIGAHYNAVIQAARGELIVTMAGDDISLPQRVAVTAHAWDASGGRLDLIACDLVDMSYDGIDLGTISVDDLSQWKSVDDWARRRPYIVGAGHAFTRRLFDRFGPLQPGVAYEDQILTLRALCSGGATTVRQPLVRYRRGGLSGRMREFSGDHYIAWTKRHNAQYVAQHAQWLADARIAGCEALIAAATIKERERELFMRDLLSASGLSSRIAALRVTRPLSFGWRLRKLLYWQWPGAAAAIRRWQAAWKRRRSALT
jgi:glycosyltransferase involved in cell wall biosynthesis